MGTKLRTVSDMVAAVRSLIDESNTTHISTLDDILPSLNRGQDTATDISVQKYKYPLLKYKIQALTSGTQEYDMPVGIYEDRVDKVEIFDSTGYTPIKRVDPHTVTLYDSMSAVPFPIGYFIVENKIRFVPAPNGQYNARIWYISTPPMLTLEQGRVTNINITDNYFLVDALGDQLSEDVDSLNSFINIISGTTGKIKATFQIQYTQDQKIAIKTSLNSGRTEIFGQTISTSLTSDLIALDDYVCLAEGSCALYLMQPFYNYIIQYAAAEMKSQKLNEDNPALKDALEKSEKRLERQWCGRETDQKVTRVNRGWRTFTWNRG